MRPRLLHSILSQHYAVLWSDSDIVWLDNPLPLLPRLDNTKGVSFKVLSFLVGGKIVKSQYTEEGGMGEKIPLMS